MFENEAERNGMNALFEKYIDTFLRFKIRHITELIPQRDFTLVVSLCTLYEAMYKDEDNNLEMGGGDSAPEVIGHTLKKMFTYVLVWSLGATADEEGRKRVDACLRDIESIYPPQGSVYDYFVDVERQDFRSWQDKVPSSYRPQKMQNSSKYIRTHIRYG